MTATKPAAKETSTSSTRPRKPSTPKTAVEKSREANKDIATKLKTEHAAAQKALDAQNTLLREDRLNAEIAARAIEQEHQTEIAVRTETAEKLSYVLTGTSSSAPVVDETRSPDAASDSTPTSEPAPSAQPSEPATTTVVLPDQSIPVPPPAPEPQEALELPKAKEYPKKNRTKILVVIRDRVGSWSGYTWLFGVIFGLVAFLVMMSIYDGFFPTRPDILRVIVTILIILAATLIGGAIGSAYANYAAKEKEKVKVTVETPAE